MSVYDSFIIKLARKKCKTSVRVQQVFILSVYIHNLHKQTRIKQFLPLNDQMCLIYYHGLKPYFEKTILGESALIDFPQTLLHVNTQNLTVPSILWLTNWSSSFRTLTPTALSFNFSIWSDMMVHDGIQRRNNKNATDWLSQGGPQQKEQVEK